MRSLVDLSIDISYANYTVQYVDKTNARVETLVATENYEMRIKVLLYSYMYGTGRSLQTYSTEMHIKNNELSLISTRKAAAGAAPMTSDIGGVLVK